ncbi:DUF6597 domain-containing transcriptional factor [Cohnella soli]|uniref:DUF6597 domain-containing transcriptional factor n=1 Tax=Cohnella soli TaxID=425005 RepID=A0ABW0HXV6_9BACL
MRFQTYVPKPPLSSFVAYFWQFDGMNPPSARRLTLPDGSVDLVIELGQNRTHISDRSREKKRLEASVISGPQSEYFITDSGNERSMIGVHFKRGKVASFLGLPSIELQNTHASLTDLWGSLATDLRDELLYTVSSAERFRILEKYLLMKCSSSQPANAAVQFALASLEQPDQFHSIADIVDQVNMSAKTFIHLFKMEVGMTPKKYGRIVRFQSAVRWIRQPDPIDWADLAVKCNYYDQPHFIKEFQAFSGLSPMEYRNKKSLHPNHIPL